MILLIKNLPVFLRNLTRWIWSNLYEPVSGLESSSPLVRHCFRFSALVNKKCKTYVLHLCPAGDSQASQELLVESDVEEPERDSGCSKRQQMLSPVLGQPSVSNP